MDNQLTPCEVAAAMSAWHLAIQAKISSNIPDVSVEELAMQYGRHTSTPGNIDAVSHFFDWTRLMEFINEEN